MIPPDADKTAMPDGSALMHEALHDVVLPSINGEHESPPGGPESPEDKGIIRCICGIDEDDGFTIFCDRCSVWQHGACVGIYDAKDAPDKYLCDQCNPRPLDVQKAKLHQRQRQEAESSHKPKRRATHHPKTKPNHHSTPLGSTPNLPPPQNRKEKHPSPPRRTEGKRPRATGRGHSTTQVETVVHEEVDIVNDEDPDIPLWPTAEDYEHRDHNEYTPEMSMLLERYLQQIDNANENDLPQDIEILNSIREFAHKTLRQPITKRLSNTFSDFVRQYGVFAAEPMGEGDLIMEFTGQVGLQRDYKSDPINQYSTLHRPKQYVIFSPPGTLDLYVDARLHGNDARYVRRSCFPNAKIALVGVVNPPERGIHFCLLTTKNIKTREEIAIGYDWNLSHPVEKMIARVGEKTGPLLEAHSPEEIRSMAAYASSYLANGECACHDEHCTFIRLRKALASLPTPSRRNSRDMDAMSIDEVHRSDDMDASDMEDDSRPNSRGTQNAGSRDRTPSKDTLIDVNAPKTAREQRKIDQAMAQFARMEEKEKGSDKRKKSDTAELDDLANKRRRQSSDAIETRPVAARTTSGRGRGVKRKSRSPSPGTDRISESGVSVQESPRPGGRVPNRVKRSLKGRKEPSHKKVRVEPPEPESSLPKWVQRTTLSESWTPPQMLWAKKYAEMAKKAYEEKLQEASQQESQPMEEVAVATGPSTATEAPAVNPPPTKTQPNLHVAMPSPSIFVPVSEQSPCPSASSSHPSASYFPSGAGSAPPPSPLSTPSTPRQGVKLSLADYRARRASGMVTPSTPTTDPTAIGENFAIPPPPSKSPDP